MQWGLANHWSELRIAERSRDGPRGAWGLRALLQRNHYIGRVVPSY
jgi:hypothetical protein